MQLKRLRHCPATAEAKAKTILAKVYSVAFYAIEVAAVSAQKTNQLSAAVVDVFRARSNIYSAHWFYVAYLQGGQDLDPYGQTLTRRVLQTRRSICKSIAATIR